MGGIQTKLKIVNDTSTDIVLIKGTIPRHFDWVLPHRPDLKFKGASVEAKTFREEVIILNPNASKCPFNMRFFFADNTEDCIALNQKFVLGDESYFNHSKCSHTISYSKEGEATLVITIRNTLEQAIRDIAKRLQSEGKESMNHKDFSMARRKFEAALEVVNDEELKVEILLNKHSALSENADMVYKEAKRLEGNQKVCETEGKYRETLELLKEAAAIQSSPELLAKINTVARKLNAN